MILDQTILHEPPVVNRIIEGQFKSFPLYIKKEELFTHKNRLHVQPGIEINLTLSGKGAFVIGNQVYMQTTGNLVLFPGNTPHQIYVDPATGYSRIVICIAHDAFSKGAWRNMFPALDMNWLRNLDCRQIQLKQDVVTQMKAIVSLMASEMKAKKQGWQTVILSQFISLSVMIRRIISDDRIKENASSKVRDYSVPLCCGYIKDHLHEDLSLGKIAEMFYVSPEHLTRQFKKEVGVSFYQYVLQERVNLSKQLLCNRPEMPMTDVAYAAGFSSPSHFSKVFKNFTKMSPSQYKNTHQSIS